MNRETVQSSSEFDGTHVCIPVPIPDPDVFSHNATGAILHLLIDNPEKSFTNRELHRLTEKGLGNVNAAVRALETLELVTVDRDGRANQVRINPAKIVSPVDRITAIPQDEYHAPVRRAVECLTDRIGTDAGIVLFGSVARGDADRASDIDLFVVVDDGRMAAQRTAHSIEDELASERFDGDRYEPHIVVETQESAVTHDQIQEILTEGLTLRETPVLDSVKDEVFANGA